MIWSLVEVKPEGDIVRKMSARSSIHDGHKFMTFFISRTVGFSLSGYSPSLSWEQAVCYLIVYVSLRGQ